MKRIAVCLVALGLLVGMYAHAFASPDDLTVLSVGSYTRDREVKLSLGWWMYSFKMNVTNKGKPPLSGVCGQVKSSSSSVKIIDPEVCFPDIPAQGTGGPGTATSKGTFTIWTNKRLSGPPSNLSWTYSSLKITADPSSLAIQQGAPYNALTYSVTLSTSAPKTYYVLFHQWFPQGIDITEQPLLTREMDQSGTWQVSEYVSASAEMESDITARAWILNTLQQAEATVPVSVTSTPPPPRLGNLGSWPPAVHPNISTDVRFTIAVSGSSLPESLTLEQEIPGGWQSIATLTDNGQDGDDQAGDAIYGGMVALTASDEEALVFRAVSPTGTSAPYALTVTPFPIGAAPTDPEKVITISSGQRVVGNRLLVRFQPGTDSPTIAGIIDPIGTVVGFLGATSYYHVEIPTTDETSLRTALATLRASSSVLAAQPDYVGEGSAVPNDPYYASQWGMWDTWGIKADQAWDHAPLKGNGVKVAVLDFGVDPTHPEFGTRVTTCEVTTDAQGDHPLECLSYAEVQALQTSDPAAHALLLGKMRQNSGHGTKVAGIIGAAGNNKDNTNAYIGIAGMAWDADIISIKVCTSGTTPVCPSSTVAWGIQGAWGAHTTPVMNLSLYTRDLWELDSTTQQYRCQTNPTLTEEDINLRDTIAQYKDIAVIVVAAGNNETGNANASTCPTYPAAFDGAIAVAATTTSGTIKESPSPPSRRGQWVHIAAPGQYIWTLTGTDVTTPYVQAGDTSLAAPHVAGVAALLRAEHTDWFPNDIRTRLLLSADKTSLSVKDGNFLNAYKALTFVAAQPTSQAITVTTSLPSSAIYNTTFNVAATGGASGNPVVITTSGGCSGGGNGSATILMTSGTTACAIQFNQAGNASFSAAPEVPRSVPATKATQTITVNPHAPATAANGSNFNVAATSSSTLAVAISTSGSCSGSGTSTGTNVTITMTSSTGTCTVAYNQAGNANYSAAAQQTDTTAAQPTSQAITVTTSLPSSAIYNTTFNVAATGGASGNPVVITTSGGCSGGGNGSATILMTSGTTACAIQFNQAGNASFSAAPEVPRSVPATKATQTITVNPHAPATAANGSNFNVAATSSSTLAVAISTSGSCSGSGTSTGTNVTITMTSSTGTCTVAYNQAGNANYSAAAQQTDTTAAQPTSQAITVTTSLPSSAIYNTTFNVAATGGASGNPVVITTSGGCSGGGNGSATILMTSGTTACAIQFNQAGNASFSAAPEVPRSVPATKATQTITVNPHAPATAANGSNFNVAATSSSTLAVAISTSGSCSGSGTSTGTNVTITMTSSTGTCTVAYNQAGNANYSAAAQQTDTTAAQPTSQAITVTTSLPSSAIYNTTFNVAATGGASGNPVVITTSGGCSGGGNGSATILMTSGTTACAIQFNQAGNASFSAAPEVPRSVPATKATQTITVNPHAPATAANGSNFNVAATSSSTLAVAISTSGSCSGSGTSTGTNVTITMTSSTGTCTVAYNQAGNANYSAAAQQTDTTAAQPTSQAITVTTSLPSSAIYNTTFNVAATGGASGNPVVITTSGGCSGGGNGSATILMTSGTTACAIQFNQAGNASFSAAPEVPRSVPATKATAQVVLSNLTQTYTGGQLTPTATTTPAGLTIVWTGAPQANVGTYNVTATINNANYQGSASGTFTILQQLPGQVTGLLATDGWYFDRVELTWSAPTTGGAPTGYRIYRETLYTIPTVNIEIGSTATRSYNDYVGDLNLYWYRVQAYNSAGTGPASDPALGYRLGVTLSVTKDDCGIVDGLGIHCGSIGTDCNENYILGTSVTLTANDLFPPCMFVTFYGCDSSSGQTCTVIMDHAKTVSTYYNIYAPP